MMKILKRPAAFLVLLCLCVLCGAQKPPIPVRAADPADASPALKFDATDVVSDLTDATVDDRPLDLSNYPADDSGVLTPLYIAEYCYSADAELRGNYGIYLYLYNPQRLHIVTDPEANTAQLAVAYNADRDPARYDTFCMKTCSVSPDGLFIKYRVIDHVSVEDGLTIAERVNPRARRYDIASVQLGLIDGSVRDSHVGGTYTYSGYAKGYGADNDPPITCAVELWETIRLDVKGNGTYYRTDMDNIDVRDHNQITSVYFKIPDRIMERYGRLQRVRATWYEYRTKPVFTTSSPDTYQDIQAILRHDTGEWSTGQLSGYYVDPSIESHFFSQAQYVAASPRKYRAKWIYNFNPRGGLNHVPPYQLEGEQVRSLLWLFDTKGEDIAKYTVPESEILAYINNYAIRFPGELLPVPNRKIPAELFDDKVDAWRRRGKNTLDFRAGDSVDIRDYDLSQSHTNKWAAALGWYKPQEPEKLPEINPIVELAPEDVADRSDLAKRLLVADKDVDRIADYVIAAAAAGETAHLLRYGMTSYYSAMVQSMYESIGHSAPYDWTASEMSQQTLFFNFDVLELGFGAEGGEIAFGVVADPIDVIGDIQTSDRVTVGDMIRAWFANLWAKISAWFKDLFNLPWYVWLIIVLLVVLVLAALFRPVWFVVKKVCIGIGYLIASPVLLLIWIVRRIVRKEGT